MASDKVDEVEPHRRAAQAVLADPTRKGYAQQQLPATARALMQTLQRHGLGQTLAHIQMRAASAKGANPFELIGRHLDRWLLAATGASGRSALVVLAGRDSRYYCEATQQAWLFLRALAEAQEATS